MSERLIKTSCRWYRGDRPCAPHKREGVTCEDCPYETGIGRRILIVKLAATGDVLRTTALLEPLRRAEPDASITWVTAPPAVPLLENIEEIDRVLPLDAGTLAMLAVESFDLVFGLDLDAPSTSLAEYARSPEKRGFGRTERGAVRPFDPAGETWLQMSLWDDLKKANQRTYQDLMLDVLHLEGPPGRIKVPLLPQHVQSVERRFPDLCADPNRPIIGLNIGAGGRWRKKAWTVEGFAALAERIRWGLNATVLLLYGPDDLDRAAAIRSGSGPTIDTGGDNTLPEFAAIMNLCSVVVTGDTLGLHLALGLGKRVVVLVGPTSAAELELYGQGAILQGAVDCLGCYLPDCDRDPDCMQSISIDEVLAAIQKQLSIAHE
ncbi:MAG: glycosyltransferase family 9 protein [bacterium]